MLTLALLTIPAVFALLIWILPQQSKSLALAGSFINLILAVVGLVALSYWKIDLLQFDSGVIGGLGMHFALEINSTSALLILLGSVILPFAIHLSSKNEERNNANFHALLMLMASAMLGAFLANDALLFYICYEVALIPIYFIILQWSKNEHRTQIVLKFFVYTLFGSLFMLMALLYVRQYAASFLINDMISAGASLSAYEQSMVFAGFFIAFAVKIPVFPFHTWQPKTYQAAPTAGTVMLAAVMLKMATYGLLRITMPLTPAASKEWAMWLCVISIVYASIVALNQRHFKLLIAYSSIAHVGMIALGILTAGTTAYNGALIEMVSHGWLALGMFYVCDMLITRYGHDDMHKMGGIRQNNATFSFLFFAIIMASVALPTTSGFVGEFLLLNSVGSRNIFMAILAGLTVIFGAVYMLRAFQTMMLGTSENAVHFSPMTSTEKFVLGIVVAGTLTLGVYPNLLLDVVQKGIELYASHI